jgi:hypothetical protein
LVFNRSELTECLLEHGARLGATALSGYSRYYNVCRFVFRTQPELAMEANDEYECLKMAVHTGDLDFLKFAAATSELDPVFAMFSEDKWSPSAEKDVAEFLLTKNIKLPVLDVTEASTLSSRGYVDIFLLMGPFLNYHVYVNKLTTVEDLKSQLKSRNHYNMVLYYRGSQLDDKKFLVAEYNMQDGGIVYMQDQHIFESLNHRPSDLQKRLN